MKYRRKKIWLNKKKTKYCWVNLYANLKDLRQAYDDYSRLTFPHQVGDKIYGASIHYERYDTVNKKLSKETGKVILSKPNCGAGVVSHEFMHQILWAHKHKRYKKQHPVVIKNMKEEEVILHNHTNAVIQFYNWYWKIEKQNP